MLGAEALCVAFSVAYFLSSTFMLTASTVFHTFCCMSARAYNFFAKLDYIGIAVQIIGSYGFISYYLFRCDPVALWVYVGLVLVCGASVVWVTLFKNIHTPGYEKHRLGLFLGFGFSVIVCGPQAVMIHGWGPFLSLLWRLGILGLLYVVGAMIYGFQIPERWNHIRFVDQMPRSHPIWHCFVLGASLWHFYTCFWLSKDAHFSAPCK
uniref:Uncharacterized protein n=1 Tax=Arcella intermedia TaxID=1963864 RepID=A0A6B2LDS6_9EUKA